MTKAEEEMIEILAEECAEVVQICMKILRHGLTSSHPESGDENQMLLEKELGDVAFAMNGLASLRVVHKANIQGWCERKAESIRPYLHYCYIGSRGQVLPEEE